MHLWNSVERLSLSYVLNTWNLDPAGFSVSQLWQILLCIFVAEVVKQGKGGCHWNASIIIVIKKATEKQVHLQPTRQMRNERMIPLRLRWLLITCQGEWVHGYAGTLFDYRAWYLLTFDTSEPRICRHHPEVNRARDFYVPRGEQLCSSSDAYNTS